MKKICIVGAGTAGTLAASIIKKRFGNKVDVTVVYDPNVPVIGVGESTTPMMFAACDFLGISFKDLVCNTDSTIKLGIKFTNWNNDNKHYFHAFNAVPTGINTNSEFNLVSAYGVANNIDNGAETFPDEVMKKGVVPSNAKTMYSVGSAVHINATTFSAYLKKRFEHEITYIEDEIVRVQTDKGNIQAVVGKKQTYTADVFIDCTGLKRQLMNAVGNSTWQDMTKYLYMDAAIPCEVPHNGVNIPNYTEAIATQDGWMWKIPLTYRYGTGYLFSRKFTKEEDAIARFKAHLKEVHNFDAPDQMRVIKFETGYYKEQWKGNCVGIGLASGFIEPLEAQAIHMIITQSFKFADLYALHGLDWSKDVYNNQMAKMYEKTYDFIRLHYHTKREDSDLWKHIKQTVPGWLDKFIKKSQNLFINSNDVFYDQDRVQGTNIFHTENWTRVIHGLGWFTQLGAKEYLNVYGLEQLGKTSYEQNKEAVKKTIATYIKHEDLLNGIKNGN
jgi:tryptophan halogenase